MGKKSRPGSCRSGRRICKVWGAGGSGGFAKPAAADWLGSAASWAFVMQTGERLLVIGGGQVSGSRVPVPRRSRFRSTGQRVGTVVKRMAGAFAQIELRACMSGSMYVLGS